MYEALKAANLARWEKAKILPARHAELEKIAEKLVANKARYQRVEQGCGVPWWFVAIVHIRESDGDFNTQLAQGDPLGHVSTHDPAGRGPFYDHPGEQWSAWERGCFDALIDCAPHAAKNQDKSLGGWLVMFELYNGLGYYNHGHVSPYVWSGTDQYSHGKYVRDHEYDDSYVDTQPGCAALLKLMLEVDSSISFEERPIPIPLPPPTPIPPAPIPTTPTIPIRKVPPVTTTTPALPPELVAIGEQLFPSVENALVSAATAYNPMLGWILKLLLDLGAKFAQARLGVAPAPTPAVPASPTTGGAVPFNLNDLQAQLATFEKFIQQFKPQQTM